MGKRLLTFAAGTVAIALMNAAFFWNPFSQKKDKEPTTTNPPSSVQPSQFNAASGKSGPLIGKKGVNAKTKSGRGRKPKAKKN